MQHLCIIVNVTDPRTSPYRNSQPYHLQVLRETGVRQHLRIHHPRPSAFALIGTFAKEVLREIHDTVRRPQYMLFQTNPYLEITPYSSSGHRKSMKPISKFSMRVLSLILILTASKAWAQAGPPFQTDDPTPVDLGHYEAYVFGTADGTPVEMDTISPGFEFNWGAIPNIQLHVIFPLGAILPSNKPIYAPAGTGPSAFGAEDMELGVKYGFIKQTKHRPQIGSFTMFEIPTGSYSKGLGVGKVWYKLPLWVEKEFGPWSLVGGLGYTVVPQSQYLNYLYGGYLVKRVVSEKLELSAEIFSHAREGLAAPQTQASTLIDAGGYYHFKSPGLQLLFAYGHSVAGQTENYAYLGLYKTWGKDRDAKNKAASDAMLSTQLHKNGL